MKTLTTPTLTLEQKQALKNLMDNYFSAQTRSDSKPFVYFGKIRREHYAYSISEANDSNCYCCIQNNQYRLNCGVFAQMIWMGRKIEDFTNHLSSPIKTISTAFNWGYYFDFISSQTSCRAKNSLGELFDENSFFSSNTKKPITFDGAAFMAAELYQKGYEIPYSEGDIGDLVFYRVTSINDAKEDAFEAAEFRNIGHVGIIYQVKSDGTYVIMECTDAFTAHLGKAHQTGSPGYGVVRGASLENKVVMCARHPAAFGAGGNVPASFSPYQYA
jgi:hypothetical protein